MRLPLPLMFAGMLWIGACTADSPPITTDTRSPAKAAPLRAVVAPPPPGEAVRPPAPAAVLEAIFRHPGDGSASYEVDNGSWATFWFGHAYQVAGKAHYTGFVEQSPERSAAGSAADDPPSAKAALTQATFVSDGARPGWTLIGTQRSVGDVGGRGRADPVDGARRPVTHQIAPGRLLLAIPTNAAIEQGTVQKNYEVLLRASSGAWSHAGTINAGHDDSAGCDEGRAFPCAPVSGRLTVEQHAGGMPAIRVDLEPGSPKAPAARSVTYRFNPSTATFQPIGSR